MPGWASATNRFVDPPISPTCLPATAGPIAPKPPAACPSVKNLAGLVEGSLALGYSEGCPRRRRAFQE